MTGWLSIDPEVVYAYPSWELEDTETGMRARGDTYLQAHQQLREYVEEYDDYNEWLASHGSFADQVSHQMEQTFSLLGSIIGGDY